MTLKCKEFRDCLIIEISGDIDLYSAPDLKKEISRYLIGHSKIIISLKNVKYIDSTAIGVLLYIYTYCNSKIMEVVFCNLQQSVMNILSLSQLDKFLPLKSNIHNSIEYIREKIGA